MKRHAELLRRHLPVRRCHLLVPAAPAPVLLPHSLRPPALPHHCCLPARLHGGTRQKAARPATAQTRPAVRCRPPAHPLESPPGGCRTCGRFQWGAWFEIWAARTQRKAGDNTAQGSRLQRRGACSRVGMRLGTAGRAHNLPPLRASLTWPAWRSAGWPLQTPLRARPAAALQMGWPAASAGCAAAAGCAARPAFPPGLRAANSSGR